MRTSFGLALPFEADTVPSGPDWLHEIKHDGYRMMVIREQKTVRLITKGRLDLSKHFPWIVESALKLHQQFIIDGEAVVLGVDGKSDFAALHSRGHDQEAQFYAFDMLACGGDDHRKLPLSLRKQNLAALLPLSSYGIHAAPFEQGEVGPHSCGELELLDSIHKKAVLFRNQLCIATD